MTIRRGLGALTCLLLGTAAGQAIAQQPDLSRLSLPDGFAIEVIAEVPGARTLVVSENGSQVFVGTRESDVFAISDSDEDGVPERVTRIAQGLKAPNGLALADDGGLYIAEQHQISKIDPSGMISSVLEPGTLPDRSHHGWRYAGIGPDGMLYVAIGAPCNICEVNGLEGTIVRLPAAGGEVEVYASGVRNSVGFDWHPETGEMFFTDNGGDDLGDDVPPDELNHAPEPGLHFGYPFVYGEGVPYPQFQGQEPPDATVPPAVPFQAHVAALGLHFYRGEMLPEDYRHDGFVAQHGSWNRTEPVGYRVMRVTFDAQGLPTGKEVFIDGWLTEGGDVLGRPVDLAELPDGSLLISDDYNGLVYRVTYEG